MKRIIICLTSFFILVNCSGQTAYSAEVRTRNYVAKRHTKLDDINSASEIEIILTSINKDYSNFIVNNALTFNESFGDKPDNESQRIADSLQIKPWTKDDFDGNGYTDLLVIGRWWSDYSILCIMDNGENKFFVKRITRRVFQDYTFAVVAAIDSTPVILYYSRKEFNWRNQKTERGLKVDTLVFLFGDFIEFNKSPAHHKIEKIDYSTGPCFGTCPIFGMIINEDRRASYNAERYNKKTGKYTTTIDTISFSLLTNLLNYIDFTKLDSSYAVGWTDDQDCTLKITYDSGLIKEIHDYGLIGTYGLDRTYDLLFKLRENQKWK